MAPYVLIKSVVVQEYKYWFQNKKILTFVMTPSLDIMLRIGSQMPMSWTRLARGRLNCVSTLNASILISIILLRKANNGPNGNATTNSVIKPN
jgi:hypothetical protein